MGEPSGSRSGHISPGATSDGQFGQISVIEHSDGLLGQIAREGKEGGIEMGWRGMGKRGRGEEVGRGGK